MQCVIKYTPITIECNCFEVISEALISEQEKDQQNKSDNKITCKYIITKPRSSKISVLKFIIEICLNTMGRSNQDLLIICLRQFSIAPS